MYKLLKPFPNGLTVMVEEVQKHIARIGLEAVGDLKGENVNPKYEKKKVCKRFIFF